jgi:hypothetical protein
MASHALSEDKETFDVKRLENRKAIIKQAVDSFLLSCKVFID